MKMRFLRWLIWSFCIYTIPSGMLCQFTEPSRGSSCTGKHITFTCVVTSGAASWIIIPGGEDGVCSYSAVIPDEETCGPDRRFTSHTTENSSNILNSSLSVLLTDDLNGTLVKCADATVSDDFIGTYNICIVGSASPPMIISTKFYQHNNVSCTLSVEWSEAILSCAGSVSQYMLSVIEPTFNCQSGSRDCQIMTNRTYYNITLTVNQTYTLTVGAYFCSKIQSKSESVSISTHTDVVESCDVIYKYSPRNRSTITLDVVWVPVPSQTQVGSSFQPVMEYTVVIEDGRGFSVREKVEALHCSSTQCNYTYYPAVGSRAEFGVSVETAGCVTRQTVCQERPVYCSLRDLSPSLVEEKRVCGSVSGGGVCYSGDSVGSVAVYFCDDGYTLEGDTTRECLSSGLWNGSTPYCVAKLKYECQAKDGSSRINGDETTLFVISILSSIIVGVVLGVVGLCLIQRVRGRLSGPTSSSPPPLPPPATYEEVDVAREVKRSQDIQLVSNKAYGPIPRNNIQTLPNTPYAQVQL